MPGISPKLPFRRHAVDGYSMNKNLLDAVKQNLKHLILTAPGERMMDPDFGVGIRNYLFEMNSENTQADISAKIYEQVEKYMPFIDLENIIFPAFRGAEDEVLDVDKNQLNIRTEFEVLPLSAKDILSLDLGVELFSVT